jgi:peptidoglycan/LPS O-acetylase OafA/YrhL
VAPPPAVDRDRNIPTLDGWRAVAILLVIVDHLMAVGTPRVRGAIAVGQIGVNLFFGLSGFLITTRLLAERERTGRISLRDFYRRRVARILPAAFVYLAVIGVIAAAGALPVRPLELVASAGFFRNYLPPALPLAGTALGAFDGFYTSHFWSLAVEEHFYLLWPPLLRRLRSVRRAGWVAVGAAVAVMVWRGLVLLMTVERTGHGVTLFTVRTDLRLDALLWGAAMAAAYAQPKVREWLTSRRGAAMWWVGVVAYVLVVAHYHARPTLWESALIPALIAGTVARPRAVVGRMLSLPAMMWVGRLSYSLYLWQQLWVPVAGMPHSLGRVQSWPFNLLAILLSAVASYYLIERPCISLGRRQIDATVKSDILESGAVWEIHGPMPPRASL